MEIGKQIKVALGHFFLVAVVEANHVTSSEEACISSGNHWQETVLLHGIIEDGCFNNLVIPLARVSCIHKLTADGRVANGNSSSSCNSHASTYIVILLIQHLTKQKRKALTKNNVCTNKHHGTIRKFGIWRLDVFARSWDHLGILGKEGNMGDTIMIKHDEAIVDRVEAKLRTDITHSDTLERAMIHEATDLDTEWMRTKVFAVENKTSHDNSMVSSLAKTTDPPFGSSKRWGVELELIGLVDVSCRSLQTLNIGAVSDLIRHHHT